MPMGTTETESINAVAREAETLVTLTETFYSCVVRDMRSKSGAGYEAVQLAQSEPPPAESEETGKITLAQ